MDLSPATIRQIQYSYFCDIQTAHELGEARAEADIMEGFAAPAEWAVTRRSIVAWLGAHNISTEELNAITQAYQDTITAHTAKVGQ